MMYMILPSVFGSAIKNQYVLSDDSTQKVRILFMHIYLILKFYMEQSV